jgi:acylphosphatase
MSEKVRAHVVIKGWVQGVAFRYKTKGAACEYQVTGWVRNKADGSVEAVFEGEKSQVESLLKWCEKGPPMAVVKGVDVSWEEYRQEFAGFDIRF